MKLMRLAVCAGLLIFFGGRLHAQCQSGEQAIMQNGLLYACVPNNKSGAQLVSYWAAFAIDSHQRLSGSWSNGSANQAEQGAVQSCVKGGGEHCLIVDKAFINSAAVAMDAAGAAYLRGAGFPKVAEKSAIKACSEMSKVGGCHLLSGGIYAGSNAGGSNANQKSFSMTDTQLLALSRERSEKKYLSTIATEITTP